MPRRDAVIVGINNYGGNGGAPDLNSCIADANAMEEILRTQYGFLRITKLLDAQATVENVDAALDDLFRNATQDDRLVFYFSGHGYRPFRDGKWIEVLVLHESRFYEDRHLSAKTQGLPPGVLTVILDSCFAGGMFKLLIPGPQGFEVGRVKVWTPPKEQVQAEEAALAQVTQVEYKAFGLAPTVLPIAVATEFGLPEPPAEMKALLLEASRAPSAAGAPAAGTIWAGAPISAAARAMPASAGALLPGPAAVRPDVAMAATTAMAGAQPGMAGSMGQPAAPKGPAAVRPDIATAATAAPAGPQPGMAWSMGQPAAGWTTEAGAPMGGTKCLVPGTQPVTALDTLAVEETGGAGGMGAGGMGTGGMGAGGMGTGGMGAGGVGTGGMGAGATKDPALDGARLGGAEPAGEGLKAPPLVPPGELEVRGVLLAASQANEPASAKTNQTEELSAFTFGLRRALREQGWDASPGEMIPRVSTTLHSMGFFQTPLLHTPVDLPLDLRHRSFVLLQPRASVGEALGTAVLSGFQPGAGAPMTPGMGAGLGKGIAPGTQPPAALTPQQATALLDLIARDPQLARTVMATLSGSAAMGAALSAGAAGAPAKAAGAPGGAAGAAGALTGEQARALLDLMAGDPQLARTVMATLSGPAAAEGPQKGWDVAPASAEAAPAPAGIDPQEAGAKMWLEAALKAAGAPR